MLVRIAEDFRFAGGRALVWRRTDRWLDLKLEYREVTSGSGHWSSRREQKKIKIESGMNLEKEIQLSLRLTEVSTIAQIQ